VTKKFFITGQKEREETTQDTIVTKSAAFASYEINYLTYTKLRGNGATAHAPPNKLYLLYASKKSGYAQREEPSAKGSEEKCLHQGE
jgi:hypothetical protein